MTTSLFRHLWVGGILLLGLGVWGCASSQQTEEKGRRNNRASTARSLSTDGPELAAQSDQVRTVQLYRGDDERNLPIVALQSSETLTLEFDLMEQQGRPLSVYFIHADRGWDRDLSSGQVLKSYRDDRILDYRSSQGTAVPYVHYTYRFPNDAIQFLVSGNYIVRVTERGRREEVLFERAFFVTEEAGRLRTGAEGLTVPGQRQRSIRPIAEYDPPDGVQSDVFGYTACFVRNGRLSDTRCQDETSLVQQSGMGFELERNRAFAPVTADYALDLGGLRSTNSIERVDRTVSPFQVRLTPDYPQFAGQDPETGLNGQVVVRAAVDGRSDPERTAEYVETTFAFVPPNEQPLQGRVVVSGSFTGMDPARGMELRWVPERAMYEGTVLLKQGQYQYFYYGEDPDLQRTIRRSQAGFRNTYTTFIYYRDASEGTDRLLRVGRLEQ